MRYAPVEVVVAFADVVGAAAFAYIAYRLASVSGRLGGRLEGPIAFSLLTAAQLFALAAVLAGHRVTYSAYVATASFSAAGFAILALASRGTAWALVPAAVPVLADLAASACAVWASGRFAGPARLLVAALGFSFVVRAAGLVMLPGPAGVSALALGEVLRSMAAAALAVTYATPPRGGSVGEAEEEQDGDTAGRA